MLDFVYSFKVSFCDMKERGAIASFGHKFYKAYTIYLHSINNIRNI